jgi:hypothetical protein
MPLPEARGWLVYYINWRAISMVRYLRIAILPFIAIAMPIPYGMADGLPSRSQAAPYGAQPHIILVDRYEDIKGCQRACKDEEEECLKNVSDVYGIRGQNEPIPREKMAAVDKGIHACVVNSSTCRQNCYK